MVVSNPILLGEPPCLVEDELSQSHIYIKVSIGFSREEKISHRKAMIDIARSQIWASPGVEISMFD